MEKRAFYHIFNNKALLASFAVVIFFLVMGPIINATIIYPRFMKTLKQNTQEHAMQVTAYILSDLFDHRDFKPNQRNPELDIKFKQIIQDLNLYKLKLFAADGRVLYSSVKSDYGAVNEHSYFHKIVASGKPYSKIVYKGKPLLDGHKIEVSVCETYVPIVRDGEFVGALELYYDITKYVEETQLQFFQMHYIYFAISIVIAIIAISVLLRLSRNDLELKSMHADIMKNEHEKTLILNSIHEGIALIDKDFNIVWGNRNIYELYGREFSPVDANNPDENKCYKSFMGLDVRCMSCGITEALKTKKPVVNEIFVNDKTLEVHVFPLFDEMGFSGFVNVARDVTEQKKLNKKIAQKNNFESIGYLAGGIAHNFNNKLTGIMGYASMLSESNLTETQTKYIDIIQECGDQLTELTKQILEFSKQGKYTSTVFDLTKLISGYRLQLEESIPSEKDISLQFNTGEGEMNVSGDLLQIEAAIDRIVQNSIEAIAEQGIISFSVEAVVLNGSELGQFKNEIAPGEYVVLTIRDNGQGVKAETIERAFEPFYSTKGLDAGLGMGLSSAYGIVTNHHGSIKIESTLGIGTTVSVFLPRAKTTT